MAFITEEERRQRAETAQIQSEAAARHKSRSLEQVEALLPEILAELETYARDIFQRAGRISGTRYSHDFVREEQSRVHLIDKQDLKAALLAALPDLFEIPPEQITSLSVTITETEGTGYIFSYDIRVYVDFEPCID